ncbi:GNAT family N-acetyltransferase [Carnobacterium divergens]|uniref:N-acetyltransferase domain-containing protein n=1 Tax=Carnobacterium divergens DSM 20623 TaxID=1449336 RepID=A0A0R2HXH3_CARDV|nr:GNAT family N-acetyltransferase [Carnobacterium divergens]KRN57455.1 hypothetical protein IV74_GL000439 [Carnobacterium divergens DSM 20623]MDO0875221.1 GNAT family N-acetyltransferase [Carnobacterium divergens]SUX17583.1 putative acetyltransferase [Carnobacterium divergens]
MMNEVIKVEVVSKEDLEEIVELHCKIFRNYFLKNLGFELVKKYYQAYDDDKGTIFLKASYNNEIVGFVLTTSNYSNIIKNFYKDNFYLLSKKIVIETLKMNKTIFLGLKSRVMNVFKKSKEENVEEEENCLLSIAIDDNFRGKKIADVLINKVEMQLKENQVKAYSLSVKKDNTGAKKFYEKIGFEKIGGKGELEYYTKKLNFRKEE